jgi:hypothetical protein
MQLSIELLPAPLGPMMARISCSLHIERDVGQGLDATEPQADVVDVQDDVADFFAHGA